MAALEALKAKHEIVGDVRGKGLMAALELVSDRKTKKPADKKTMAAVAEAAYQAGVMIRVSGANIILSPPLIITASDVAEIARGLDAGLAAA
jgi:putrescine aminotransferase